MQLNPLKFAIVAVLISVSGLRVANAEIDCVDFANTLKTEMEKVMEVDGQVADMQQAAWEALDRHATALDDWERQEAMRKEALAEVCAIAKENILRADTIKKFMAKHKLQCERVASFEFETYDTMFHDAPLSRSLVATDCQ